jgi:hypothetical protein
VKCKHCGKKPRRGLKFDPHCSWSCRLNGEVVDAKLYMETEVRERQERLRRDDALKFSHAEAIEYADRMGLPTEFPL